MTPPPVLPAFEEAFSPGALYRAYRRALHRHRRDAGAAAFTLECGPAVCDLSRRLLAGTWVPSPVRTFRIRDPKPRTVCVTPFTDRVVHHALVAALEPAAEPALDPDSYACRKGKGIHRCVGRAQEYQRVHDWFVALDVRHYFPNVPHATLVAILAGLGIPGPYQRLVRRILEGAPCVGPPPGRGMPIGALTSQFLGNVGLDPVERMLRADFPDCDHVRYMDDIVVFGPSRTRVREAHRAVDAATRALGLELKPSATVVAPATEGLSFLGFRVHGAVVRPDRATRVRLNRRIRAAEAAIRDGSARDPDRARAGIATRINHLLAGGVGGGGRRRRPVP